MSTSLTPTNPGVLIKSQLVLNGIKIKDLATHCGKVQSAVSQCLKLGSIPIPLALTLEKLGIGTAQQWVTHTALYRLHLHQLRETSAQA